MAQAAGRTLGGPDQGADLFIFVSYSFLPRRWTSLFLAAFKLIALLPLVTRFAQLPFDDVTA
jgi:hypothetical protein